MQLFCIEQNYVTQKVEKENPSAITPTIYVKNASALLLTGAPFMYSGFDLHTLYAQGEIALRVSNDGKNISKKEASSFYDALTMGINFTAIDFNNHLNGIEVSWEEAKDWEFSSVIGDWLPMADFKNIHDINFCLYKNRELMQIANTGLMINDFNKIISTVSHQYPLMAGDIIFTGSPVGIPEINPHDQLEAFVEDDTSLELEVLEG